ncbi:MAG: hypothetical protein MZV49_01165 [Rhodopseudomonas palustris]|nr:hypothetical protein [Rhodopseudomonas palustris]
MPSDGGGPVAASVPGLLWAFRIDSEGRPHPLAVNQAAPLEGPELIWLHVNLADARVLQWLATELAIPASARTLLLSKDTYQQLHVAEDCVYGVIADLLRDIDGATEDAGHLRFVLQERLVISGRYGALCGVDAARRALEAGRRISSAAVLFETIIDHVASTMAAMAERMQDQLDAIEEEVLSGDPRRSAQGARGSCGAPACGCIGNCRGCSSSFTGSSSRTSATSLRGCRSRRRNSRSGSMSSTA